MIRRLRFMIWLFFLISFTAYGKNDVRFALMVPEKIYPNREFTIIFRLENAEGQDFRAPKFNGCQVIKGPSVSRSSQYTMDKGRGGFLNYTDYKYILRTDRKKKIEIGSATVRVDGKLIKSAPRNISIDQVSAQNYSGGAVEFSAVIPDKVEVGEAFKVVFVLKNAQGEDFNFPIVKNCEFLYGPEISRSGSFLFWGRSPIETTYTLVLKAKKAGVIKLPSATVNVNGKMLKSKKIKIKVLPESEMTRKKKFNEAQRKYQSI